MPPRAKLKAPAAARAAAAPGATVEHLPEVLRALLSVENESRGIAEATLKALAKDARSGGVFVAALLQHARSDADAAVRQLAAVVLKRRVLTHWSALPVDHQEQFKNVLLEGIVSEPVPAVRRAIADVVSKVAKATVPLGAWNALPEFLAQCSASPEESHRVVAFVLFASLTETIVGTMTKHFSTLGGLFTGGLSDASSQVRVAALKAVLALVINAPGESKEETNVLSSLVVPVLAVAKHALESGEEKYGSLAFEVLDELVEQQPKALTGHIELVVAFCLEVASLGNLDNTTRRKALDVLSFLARHKPKALVKAKIVPNLIKALCPLCGEPKEDLLYGDDEVDENTETSEEDIHVQTVAARLVDLLSLNAPSKHVLPEVLAFASSAIGDASDQKKRHAAVAVLGIVAEGCAEGLADSLAAITPAIINALTDTSSDVRSAAAFTLGQLAEWVDGATAFHATALPAVFAALKMERDPRVLERLMYVLDTWLERLEEHEVRPYITPTLHIAYAAIDNGAQTSHRTKEASLGAVASAAAAAGRAMHEHLPSLLPRLETFLLASLDQDLKSRARALEVLGMLISGNGGTGAMAAHIPSAMRAAHDGFDLEYTELREYGHGLFAETAQALGDELFAEYLPVCVEKAKESLELDDGVAYDSEDDDDDANSGDDSDDGSDNDDRNGGINYSVFSGVVEEKAAACRAVASYALYCPVSFLPYLPKFTETMSAMTDHMHDAVRAQAHAALARIAQCALRASPRSSGADPDSSPAFAAVDASLNATHRSLTEDDDRDAVAAAMEAAAAVIQSVGERDGLDFKRIGVSTLVDSSGTCSGIARLHAGQHIENLSSLCLSILQGKAACQEDVHDEIDFGGDEDEEFAESETAAVVLEACAELLPKLVAVAGQRAAPAFEPHFNELAKRIAGDVPEPARSVAYATIVEMIKAIGKVPFVAAVAPVILRGCVFELRNAKTAGLRRNCVYCAGVIFEMFASSVDDAGKTELAEVLCLVLAKDETNAWREKDPGTRDNAAGAVARTLLASGSALARDEQIGPSLVASLLRAIPLTSDFEECVSVYGGAVALLAMEGEVNGVGERRIGQLVHAFARIAEAEADRAAREPKQHQNNAEPGDATGPSLETLREIATAVRRARNADPGAVDTAIAALSDAQRNALTALLAAA